MSISTDKTTVRVFFALWPDAAERAALSAFQPVLKALCKGRVMLGGNLHATLVFLGNVDVDRLDEVYAAANSLKFDPFHLVWNQICCWKHNHIVHAAAEYTPEPLALLVRQLEENLLQRGFDFERRPYQPHVTLLRNARCDQIRLPEPGKLVWEVREFVLLQSVNGDHGTRYDVLMKFPCVA